MATQAIILIFIAAGFLIGESIAYLKLIKLSQELYPEKFEEAKSEEVLYKMIPIIIGINIVLGFMLGAGTLMLTTIQ